LQHICCSQYLLIFCLYTYLYFLPFLGGSMGFLSGNIFQRLSERPLITAYVPFLTQPLLSVPCRNSKSVTFCNPSFRNEMPVCCKKVWVTLRVKVNMKLKVTTMWNVLQQSDKSKGFTVYIFTQTNILIVPSCTVWRHNMNYQNMPPWPDF
jgi:hypothetical protein